MAILNNSNAISSGGYDINNSLRFRSSASAYLSRTPATTTNRQTWTYSAWFKRGKLGANQNLFAANATGVIAKIILNSDDTIDFQDNIGPVRITTVPVYRDPSAWYHIVFIADTTQATSSNRLKIYINGSQVTALQNVAYPAQNYLTQINSNIAHTISTEALGTSNNLLDGYLAEVNFIDGQALTPSSFGSTDATTGQWQPAKYTGTYGTNGFYLKFSDIATTSGSNAGLGKDFSGNGNYWNTNNISVTAGITYDAMTDVPTNTSATVANYCTLNPIRYGIYPGNPAVVLSEANLKASWGADPGVLIATMNIPSTGKWYWEAVIPTQTYNFLAIGVIKNQETASINQFLGTPGYCLYASNGQKYILGANSAYMAAPAQNTVITVAFDADTGTLYIGAGGSWANGSGSTNQPFSSAASIVTGLTGDISPAFSFNTGNFIANFGQRPFTYTPPTGYKALNTFNLPDSTIKKGNTVTDATLYSGNGATRSITNDGAFKPDFVWIKARSIAYFHRLVDSVRGTGKELYSNDTGAETTNQADGYVSAFNSNGFSILGGAGVNGSGNTYVAWQWQAGQGSSSSNTQGSITSTVSVNTTAGFSIVTYTGTGANATVGHGLGVAPKMLIVKSRSAAVNWVVYNASLGNTGSLYLNLTNSFTTVATWNNTSPTPSVFSVNGTGYYVNDSAATYVAYCWAEIAGFSKFGSYTGNGSTDGPFVYTGFRPKFIMYKRTDSTGSWGIFDTSRNTYNLSTNVLYANLSSAEYTSTGAGFDNIDILSNGFKPRQSNSGVNASGGTYIYMAFAENPFKSSLAR